MKFSKLNRYFKLNKNEILIDFEQTYKGQTPLLFVLSKGYNHNINFSKTEVLFLINNSNLNNVDTYKNNYLHYLIGNNSNYGIFNHIEMFDLIKTNRQLLNSTNERNMNAFIYSLKYYYNDFTFEQFNFMFENSNFNKEQIKFLELNNIIDDELIHLKSDISDNYLNFIEKRNLLIEKKELNNIINYNHNNKKDKNKI